MDTYLVHREAFLSVRIIVYYNFEAMISLRKDVMAFVVLEVKNENEY